MEELAVWVLEGILIGSLQLKAKEDFVERRLVEMTGVVRQESFVQG